MAFYDLPKTERILLVAEIHTCIEAELQQGRMENMRTYYSDEDTYIRKTAYLETGKIFYSKPDLQFKIIKTLELLLPDADFKVRQTAVNAAGEIGKKNFNAVRHFFDTGLFDPHHAIRNAVIGSVKKMGEVNPLPVLDWARLYLHHENKEIRREICHGIELRGRRYPQDILPMLQELQNDKTARVRNTLVHVIGQIAYKKGCLQTVISHLKTWDNQQLVADALAEIIDVHERYKNFSVLSQDEARAYIEQHYP
jgi:hypothetical protein